MLKNIITKLHFSTSLVSGLKGCFHSDKASLNNGSLCVKYIFHNNGFIKIVLWEDGTNKLTLYKSTLIIDNYKLKDVWT